MLTNGRIHTHVHAQYTWFSSKAIEPDQCTLYYWRGSITKTATKEKGLAMRDYLRVQLWPLLFLVYSNDIPKQVEYNIIIFADYT